MKGFIFPNFSSTMKIFAICAKVEFFFHYRVSFIGSVSEINCTWIPEVMQNIIFVKYGYSCIRFQNPKTEMLKFNEKKQYKTVLNFIWFQNFPSNSIHYEIYFCGKQSVQIDSFIFLSKRKLKYC